MQGNNRITIKRQELLLTFDFQGLITPEGAYNRCIRLYSKHQAEYKWLVLPGNPYLVGCHEMAL